MYLYIKNTSEQSCLPLRLNVITEQEKCTIKSTINRLPFSDYSYHAGLDYGGGIYVQHIAKAARVNYDLIITLKQLQTQGWGYHTADSNFPQLNLPLSNLCS